MLISSLASHSMVFIPFCDYSKNTVMCFRLEVDFVSTFTNVLYFWYLFFHMVLHVFCISYAVKYDADDVGLLWYKGFSLVFRIMVTYHQC